MTLVAAVCFPQIFDANAKRVDAIVMAADSRVIFTDGSPPRLSQKIRSISDNWLIGYAGSPAFEVDVIARFGEVQPTCPVWLGVRGVVDYFRQILEEFEGDSRFPVQTSDIITGTSLKASPSPRLQNNSIGQDGRCRIPYS